MHILLAIPLCGALAYHGIIRQSLSVSGAIAAVLVGLATFTHPSPLFSAALITFYLSSSRLTKVGARRKKKLEEGYEDSSKRTATQVLSNGVTGSALCLLHHMMVGAIARRPPMSPPGIPNAFVGHYACCNGDTWASELGILNRSLPRLITTFAPVPPGTNGAISLQGTLASAAGGAVVGLASALGLWGSGCLSIGVTITLTLLGTFCGLVGSLIDSLLGATLQQTRYHKRKRQVVADFRRPKAAAGEVSGDFDIISGWEVLDNHQVNFISSLLVSVGAGLIAYAVL
ncbi:integral membrane protein DUF92-domain-containing protein [Zopfochytrium polystomum]|nr:integral membrane protein DUF92-domain-containing protein [Zopfochytrium polystomum]